MTKIIRSSLFLCFLFLANNLFAQQMEWSNTRKLKGSAVFTGVIGKNQSGIYLLRFRNKFLNKNIVLERYRDKLGLIAAKNIVLKKSRLLYAGLGDDGLVLVSSYFNRKSMQNEVRAQYYDLQLHPIWSARTVFTSTLVDYYDKGDFRVKVSTDKSKVLVYHTEKTEEGNRSLHIHVCNASMDVLEKKSVELDIEYDDFLLTNAYVDNYGNSFFLIGERKLNPRKTVSQGGKWHVFHYNPKTDSLSDYQVLDSGLRIVGSYFSWDMFKNKINLTAFYEMGLDEENQGYFDDQDVDRITDSENPVKGLYNFEYPLDSGLKPSSHYVTFTTDFEDGLLGDKVGLGSDGIKNFKILEIIPASNGGLTLVAERSSFLMEQDITYVNGLPQTMARNVYNYDDVLVMNLDSAYNIRWKHVINKSQSSLNDGGYYSSVSIANTRSHLYIIYNDRLRTNGDVIQYTFTPTGEVSYKILIRSETDYVSIIPSESKQIGYNTLLLPVSKDNKFSLLKLVYPN